MASVRQWPHRRVWTKPHDVNVTLASTRSEHGTPGSRRRQARSPAAREPNTPGCQPDERLSSRPSAAGWSEAVRGTGVPRAAKGAVELRNPRNEECDGMPMVRPRPPTGPVALRGGRHGAATAPPARGPGTCCASGVGSAMASPPRGGPREHATRWQPACHKCLRSTGFIPPIPRPPSGPLSGEGRIDCVCGKPSRAPDGKGRQ
jgi:hypothetical protein